MHTELRSQALAALFWSGCERIGQQGVQFVFSIVLARLLMPEQFGLIGMLAIFIAVAQIFLDGGFGSALIQKRNTTHVDMCSVFYFNIAIGVISTVALCIAAPFIADFYKQPVLTPVTRVLSLSIVLNSFGLIQTTLLVKAVDFRAQAKVTVLTTTLAGFMGVGFAYNGFGVWSLVVQQVGGSLCRVILLWLVSSWRPSFLFSMPALRSMSVFGWRMLASGLLGAVCENAYFIVIGKAYSAATVGFYARAWGLQEMFSAGVSVIVSRVTFPLFASIQDDVDRLKRGLKHALSSLAFINFPLCVGLAIVAEPLVTVLLSSKWLPCVPYLQLLAIVGLMYPLHAVNLNLLKALGYSDLLLRLEIIKRALTVLNIAVTWRFGIEAMIYGHLVLTVGCYYLNSYYAERLVGYSRREQIGDVLPALGLAMLMGISVYSVGQLPFMTAWSLLAAQLVIGVVTYCTFAYILRITTFVDGVEYARDSWKMYLVWRVSQTKGAGT